MALRNIKEILQDLLDRAGYDEKIEEYKALLMWDDVAPKMIARTQPVGIKDGKMIVSVTDSVVLHQLSLFKRKYIDKINMMLGKETVKEIIFRVGKVQQRSRTTENRDDYIRRLHSIQLDQDQLARINELVGQIEDGEIRDSLRELFISQGKLTKMRGGLFDRTSDANSEAEVK